MQAEIIKTMLLYCKEHGITAKTILSKNVELSEKTVASFFAGKMENARTDTVDAIANTIGMKIVATVDGETPLDKARYEEDIRVKDEVIATLTDQNAELTNTLARLREDNKAASVEAEKKAIEIKWLRRCLRVCSLILLIVLLICIGVVLIDLLNHNVGWVRTAVQQLSGSSIYGTSVRL